MFLEYSYNLGIRFQSIASLYAERVAIWFNAQENTNYSNLNHMANQVARWLDKQDLVRGDVVFISGQKTIQTYVAILGCLKLGLIYSIMDPDSPMERLRKIISTCMPRLIIGESAFINKVKETEQGNAVIYIEKNALGTAIADYDGANLSKTRVVTGANPAYIMFTSGSTGFPKGAVMTHANVLNLIEWGSETYRIVPEDVLTNVNPLYFDNSVFDFYSALFNGACLVPFTKEEVRDPKILVEKIDAARCNQWFSVPSLLIFLQTMKAANGKYLRTIRRFIFGGEGYPKAKLKQLYDTYKDTALFYNVYGPTECTCICSSYLLSDNDFEDIQGVPPLGWMANNFDYLILGNEDRIALDGEVGELCLLGTNVGRGYYNDPERTAVSFVQNPHNRLYYDIIYRTGDLVRLNPVEGKIYFHGRKDRQIKHMGYRIELTEIEAAIHCLDYISEGAVLHTNIGGLSRIIAVVAAGEVLDEEKIQHDLREIIPDYMIPTVFYQVRALPKNPNGKVDRKFLEAEYCQPT